MSIDPRLSERRKSVAEEKAKRNVGRLLKFLLIVMVVGAGVWLAFSPWLSISQVTTIGVESSDGYSVLTQHGVVAGGPMISTNTAEVEAALLRDPWVAEATVRRDWPDTVSVEVVERVPVAWVLTESGWARRAIDGHTVPSPSEPGDEMARIEMDDVSAEDAATSVDVLGALEFVQALPADLHQGTVVTRIGDEIWASVSGYQVRLGRSTDMAEKALSLDALLAEDIPEDATLVLIAPTNPAHTTASANDGADSADADDDGGGDDDPADSDADS